MVNIVIVRFMSTMKGASGMAYKVTIALGKHIIIEPVEKSTVLKADEISTVFKVVSFPFNCSLGSHVKSDIHFNIGDLIIVREQSVQKTKMGDMEVYFVEESDVIAKVEEVDSSSST